MTVAATLPRDLHPPTSIRRSARLTVSGGHSIHVEEAGNPQGAPVLLLHGGPGGPASPDDRRFFDAARHRIVAFDQRGALRSRPLGELAHNTLDHLVDDIESVRRSLGIDRWLVFGGSFGSTLALRYAQTHRSRCCALIVWATLPGRQGFELWDFEASRLLFPHSWAALARDCPIAGSGGLAARYFAALLSSDTATSRQAAEAWNRHSRVLSQISSGAGTRAAPGFGEAESLAAGRLAAHYWQNRLFLPPGRLLDAASDLAGLPGVIVHGQADRNCLIEDSVALHARWAGSRFVSVPDAGHSCFEPGIARAILDAVRQLS